MSTPLTQRALEKETTPGRYHDSHGLHLKISPSGTKAWILRYQIDGKRHDLGLGAFPDVSLSAARKAAMEARVKINNGYDPLALKRQQAASAITVETEVLDMIERYRAGWSEKHASQWINSMRDHVFPYIGSMPIDQVDTDAVLLVLDPIWSTKPETARRVRNRLERVINYAKARGNRIGDNPARWRGHLQNVMASNATAKRPLESLPYNQLPRFMRTLESLEGMSARCMQFLILTACRSNEAMGATWDEIDFKNKVWTIPATRMKGGEEHQIPLSDEAIEVLYDTKSRVHGNLIFHSKKIDRALANNTLRRLMTKLGSEYTPHGFRATFRTWADEQTTFSFELCEISLAHVIGSTTSRAYIRGNQLEKRRPLMNQWAKFATGKGEVSQVLRKTHTQAPYAYSAL